MVFRINLYFKSYKSYKSLTNPTLQKINIKFYDFNARTKRRTHQKIKN